MQAPAPTTTPIENFESLSLPPQLLTALKALDFTTPTPVQAMSIPAIMAGRDVLGSAQTGTGKTGAFGIPLVADLMKNPRGTALVMTPTRELAMQVLKVLESFLGRHSPIKTALLIGGDPMPRQLQQLRARPRLIVGTPGRINDHLARGSLMLHDTSFLVLDETDRMLDMGFSVQIEKILKFMPQKRQTLLFSATLPHNILRMAEKYLQDPVRVAIGSTVTAAPKIKQEVITVREEEKYDRLLDQLKQREGSVIMFVKTKWGADKMAERLRKHGHSAEAIHGDLNQSKRGRVIAGFRDSKYRILVATDIAARGLDISHIRHVINYDLPQCPEDYIHRIGRTARGGAEGEAICFVTGADRIRWNAIQRLMNPEEFKNEPRNHSGAPARKEGGARKRPHRRGGKDGNSSQGNNGGHGGQNAGSGNAKGRSFRFRKTGGGAAPTGAKKAASPA